MPTEATKKQSKTGYNVPEDLSLELLQTHGSIYNKGPEYTYSLRCLEKRPDFQKVNSSVKCFEDFCSLR